MGRNYRTSQGNNIDYIYKAPVELMAAAIKNVDDQNDLMNNQLSLFGDELVKMPFLDPDKTRVEEIQNQYKQRIDDLSATITKNPGDWRKYQSTIKDLGRQLTSDITSGELSAIKGNYDKYTQWDKMENERFRKGEVDAQMYSTAKSKYLNDFKGTQYSPSMKTGEQIKVNPLSKTVDVGGEFDKILKDVVASSEKIETGVMKGMYKITTENGIKTVPISKLVEIAKSRYQARPDIQQYLKQGTELGVFDGNNVLNNAIASSASKYGFTETSNKFDVSGNPVAMQQDAQAHSAAMQASSQDHAKKMADLNLIYDVAKEGSKSAQNYVKNTLGLDLSDLPEKGGSGSGSGGSKDATSNTKLSDAAKMKVIQDELDAYEPATKDKPQQGLAPEDIDKRMQELGVGKGYNAAVGSVVPGAPVNPANPVVKLNELAGSININAFVGDKTKLTVQKVAANLEQAKKTLAVIQASKAAAEKSGDKVRFDIEQENEYRALSAVENTRAMYQKSFEKGFSTLEDEEKALYSTMMPIATQEENRIKKLRNTFNNRDLMGGYPGEDPNALVTVGTPMKFNKDGTITIDTTEQKTRSEIAKELKEKEARFNKFKEIKAKVDKGRDEYIQEISKTTGFETPVVKSTPEQNTLIYEGIKTNGNSFEIIDAQTGRKGSDLTMTGTNALGLHGQDNRFTFAGDAEEANIWRYLNKSNKKLEDVMKIEGFTASNMYGGSTAVVTFKGVGGIDPDRKMIVKIPRPVETQLGGALKDHTDPKLKAIGNSILDDRKARLIGQLQGHVDQQNLAPSEVGIPYIVDVDNHMKDGTNNISKIRVTPIGTSTGEPMIKAELQDMTKGGVWSPIGIGTYVNYRELINAFYTPIGEEKDK